MHVRMLKPSPNVIGGGQGRNPVPSAVVKNSLKDGGFVGLLILMAAVMFALGFLIARLA